MSRRCLADDPTARRSGGAVITVPQWSSFLMLRNLKSPETYFQAAFHVQSPWSLKNPNGDDPHEEEILKLVYGLYDIVVARK